MPVLFMSPIEMEDKPLSGSRARPLQMMSALRGEVDELVEIFGDSATRAGLWKKIPLDRIQAAYVELSTRPLALTDPDYMPRRPFMDMAMLQKLRQAGAPVGVFYRDVHWRFPQYSAELGLAKRTIARAFHRLELRQLQRVASHLFLPSMRMLAAVPIDFPRERVSALPPGAQVREGTRRSEGPLQLFYVGGVAPPLYDLTPAFEAMSRVRDAHLTVCCREWEWAKVRGQYRVPSNVDIVHAAGSDLERYYASADAFLLCREMTEYLELAMPVKLFEAIGAGLPVITNTYGEAEDFIRRENCGWTVRTQADLEALLRDLAQEPMIVREKRRDVELLRDKHSWSARAREILDTLADYRGRGVV